MGFLRSDNPQFTPIQPERNIKMTHLTPSGKWERIRLAREAAGMSRDVLALRIGCGKGMIQKWETPEGDSEHRNPKDGTLLRIAMETTSTFQWLKDGTGPMWDKGHDGVNQLLQAQLAEKGWAERLRPDDHHFLGEVASHGHRSLDDLRRAEAILLASGIAPAPAARLLLGEHAPEAEEIEAEQQKRRETIRASLDPKAPHSAPAGYSAIPIYSVRAAAGPAYENGTEEIEDEILFSSAFLRHTMRIDPASAAIIHIEGDSMQGVLSPGDLVIVDMRPAMCRGDGIYLLRHGNSTLVKSIQHLPAGAVKVISTNTTYPPYIVSPEEAEAFGFEILGRVVCALRRM